MAGRPAAFYPQPESTEAKPWILSLLRETIELLRDIDGRSAPYVRHALYGISKIKVSAT